MINKRFPVQGNCSEPCPNPRVFHKSGGIHPSHETYGSVPWEIGMQAFKVWNRQYGKYKEGSPEDLQAKSIANRGGFGYWEMTKFTGSEDWKKYFIANKGVK